MTKTRLAKLLIAIWILICALLIGFAIVGQHNGDLPGYILFSFMPVAILANISIVIAYKGAKNILSLTSIGWSILCILDILFYVALTSYRTSGDFIAAGIVIIYPMMVLSFPSGFLLLLFYGGLSYLRDSLGLSFSLGCAETDAHLVNAILWLGLFIGGYLQWFKLFPYLLEKWRNRKS